ncbi:MAG TPA: nucleotide exchange factor GrpE [Xanthobacteraceae bacterium]|nr:nucleotide exchange factor GrpE [Xanthobacteraceae bacterium]
MTDTTGVNDKVTDAGGLNDKMADATSANDNDAETPVENRPAAPDATALAREVADYKDKLLRTLADMENLRRRTEREVADARIYGVSSLARDLVGVADNLRRALEAVGESAAAIEGPAKPLHEGVELIERELLKVLERHGVKKFDPQGVKFDPNFHQAIFEVPDSNIAAGSVAQVIQPGFMIGERVLRPAMVGVSKGRPKPEPPKTEPPPPSADEKQSS